MEPSTSRASSMDVHHHLHHPRHICCHSHNYHHCPAPSSSAQAAAASASASGPHSCSFSFSLPSCSFPAAQPSCSSRSAAFHSCSFPAAVPSCSFKPAPSISCSGFRHHERFLANNHDNGASSSSNINQSLGSSLDWSSVRPGPAADMMVPWAVARAAPLSLPKSDHVPPYRSDQVPPFRPDHVLPYRPDPVPPYRPDQVFPYRPDSALRFLGHQEPSCSASSEATADLLPPASASSSWREEHEKWLRDLRQKENIPEDIDYTNVIRLWNYRHKKFRKRLTDGADSAMSGPEGKPTLLTTIK